MAGKTVSPPGANTVKRAVILFNLGGPDSPDAVGPFLFNLFSDPAILGLPQPLRWMLARLLAARRTPKARAIYETIGGRSPLLDLTKDQAAAVESRLRAKGPTRVFIAMRYWRPSSDETARAVKEYGPDEIVLLPLYPQFSTTTTGSSVTDWLRAARGVGLGVPTRGVCCYPTQGSFIKAHERLLRTAMASAPKEFPIRVLFSAHGLPKKFIEGGDPYQWQVEQTAAAIADAAGLANKEWVICYQSRVGPLAWIGPNIDGEIVRAARDRVTIVVAPVAFVSEHSETLVELDVQYAKRAKDLGVPAYIRVPALGVEQNFISCLANLVETTRPQGDRLESDNGSRRCPEDCGKCAVGQLL